MHILIMNDDGIKSEGIYALAQKLAALGELTIVAPAEQRSGASHCINIEDTFRAKEIEFKINALPVKAYSVNANPADCAKLALFSILKNNPPDLAISGINAGNNAGFNAIYSGTIAAAAEAAIAGVPAMAVSLNAFRKPDFSAASDFALKFAKKLIASPLPSGVVANINLPAIPKEQIKGVKLTFQSMMRFEEWYKSRCDFHDRKHYWLEGDYKINGAEEGSDLKALESGYISVTPMHFNLTCQSAMQIIAEYKL